jgi:hypothetical protein
MQILDRWGPIDTSEVTQHLAQIFGVEESEIKRNVQNDLKFLRDEGDATPLYYDKLGNFLGENAPPEDGSYFKVQWQSSEKKDLKISGLGELRRFKGDLICSPSYEKNLSIRYGKGPPTPGIKYFYFDLNHELFHIALQFDYFDQSKDDLLHIGLGRSSSDSISDKLYAPMKELDAPSILLSLKDPFLSTLEEGELPPFLITIHKDQSVSLKSHQNKNPLHSLEVTEEQVHKTLSELTFFKDKTKTQHWTDLNTNDDLFIEGARNFLQGPVLIKIKSYSGFILT